MNVLVTGGAGFIGSNLVDKLVDSDHKVIVIDNESSTAHTDFYYNKDAEYWDYDISNYNTIEPLFQDVDYVFHLAAECRIQESIENPLLCINTNCVGTCNVLQASVKHNIKKFIYSSSSSIYGNTTNLPTTEDVDDNCQNPYSVSKKCGEDLCKMYYDLFGLDTVSLRYFNVYGDRQPTKGRYAPVIGLLQKQIKQGKEMIITGDGLQSRDFINVKDVVEANIMAINATAGNVYNIGTGVSFNMLELAHMIEQKPAYILIDGRPGEARHTMSNSKKALNDFGWKPMVKLDEWIKTQNH